MFEWVIGGKTGDSATDYTDLRRVAGGRNVGDSATDYTDFHGLPEGFAMENAGMIAETRQYVPENQ